MAAKTGFTPWLSEYLDTIGMDGDVYGEYIASCLHGLKESTEEERMEAVMEFVSGVLNDDIEDSVAACERILKEWDVFNPKSSTKKQKKRKKILTMEDHVDQIIKTTAQASSGTDPSHSLSVRPNRQPPALSQSEKKLMLRQYGYASDEQTDEDDDHSKTTSSATIGMNLNKTMVGIMDKEKRDIQKQSHEEKLERDKQSREIQKQRKVDRKEKEKQRTQKQERRR